MNHFLTFPLYSKLQTRNIPQRYKNFSFDKAFVNKSTNFACVLQYSNKIPPFLQIHGWSYKKSSICFVLPLNVWFLIMEIVALLSKNISITHLYSCWRSANTLLSQTSVICYNVLCVWSWQWCCTLFFRIKVTTP